MRFFKAIVAIIQFVAEKHANPYIETIKVITSGGDDPGESYKLGPYTLTDLQQSVSRSPYTANLADNSLRRALTASSPFGLTTRSLATLLPCGTRSRDRPSSQDCILSTKFPLSTQEKTLA